MVMGVWGGGSVGGVWHAIQNENQMQLQLQPVDWCEKRQKKNREKWGEKKSDRRRRRHSGM